MSIRHYRLLNLLLLLALFAGSAWAYPRLPARIPMHFDFAGRPDRWEARSVVWWFLLPVITTAMAALLHTVSAYGTRHPDTWNLPDKRLFLKLTPVEQAPIIARMQAFVAFIALVVTALLGGIQAGVYHASTGDGTGLPVWTSAGIGAALLVIGIASVRLNAEVGRMVREAHARTGG